MSTDGKLALMIESLIGRSDLTPYFHVKERPERVPVKVAVADPERFGTDAQAFGSAIVFVPASKGDDAALQVTIAPSAGATTRIDFIYPPEGVAGHAVFSDGSEPKLESVSIVER